MSDPATLLLPNGDVAVEGAAYAAPSEGLVLKLPAPPGVRLAEAFLQVAAPPPASGEIGDAALISDLGPFPGSGEPVAWLRASLPEERAITGVNLRGAGGGARLRVFSRGAWRPLTPPDTIALAADSRRDPVPLTAFAASAVMVELLAAFKPTTDAPAIFLPAPQKVSGLTLFGSGQPCHLAVAVGEDPPFFVREGPLPPQPTVIEGLLRAMARFLAEHPEATAIPLRITTAGPSQIILAGTRFSTRPAQAQGGATPVKPAGETLFPPNLRPLSKTAQLCDETHWVAQHISLPKGAGQIANLGLWLRAGPGRVAGGVALHGGGVEGPEPEPLPGLNEAPLVFEATGEPAWAICRPPEPWRVDRPAWVVCRVTAGEALWFTGDARPPAFGPAMTRSGGGRWAAVQSAGAKGWAQLRLSLAPRDV